MHCWKMQVFLFRLPKVTGYRSVKFGFTEKGRKLVQKGFFCFVYFFYFEDAAHIWLQWCVAIRMQQSRRRQGRTERRGTKETTPEPCLERRFHQQDTESGRNAQPILLLLLRERRKWDTGELSGVAKLWIIAKEFMLFHSQFSSETQGFLRFMQLKRCRFFGKSKDGLLHQYVIFDRIQLLLFQLPCFILKVLGQKPLSFALFASIYPETSQ